jgi:fructose-1,6-bisphosphatase/inositol monophosphatase family enzyme
VADGVIEEVGSLLRETAASAVLPLFGRLDDADIEEKAPGEVVTVADRRAEQIISERLVRLLPDSFVVGEEGVAADPSRLSRLTGTGPLWLVDPVDGTANFAAGRRPFAMMVALLRARVIEAGWILDPSASSLAVARAGAGAYVDGVRVRTTGDAPPPSALRGAVTARWLPPLLRASVQAGTSRLGEALAGQHCAGREYLDVLAGLQHFVLFWRTLPWDHAPGVLLIQEAGGVARRLDGSAYDPADERPGLLVAANEHIWATVHETLLRTT